MTVIRSIKFFVIVSASKHGIIKYKINNVSVTGEDFKDYILILKLKCLQLNILNLIFVLYNALIYHYSREIKLFHVKILICVFCHPTRLI